MKQIIALLLCLALLMIDPIQSRAPETNGTLVVVVVVLTITAMASAFIITLYAHNPRDPTSRKMVAVVLEYSNDAIVWNPAITNIIPENSGPTPAFVAYKNDHEHEYYRTRQIPMPSGNLSRSFGRFQAL